MRLYFCNGGGSSRYDDIAKAYGWYIGCNSGGKSLPRVELDFIDNDWRSYDHEKHLSWIKKHRPSIATARDIEDEYQWSEIERQALEIAEYAEKVILIPKTNILQAAQKFFARADRLDKFLWGVPSGPHKHKCFKRAIESIPLNIHLLGGSPTAQYRQWYHYGDRVQSLDGNYAKKISRYCKVCGVGFDRKPTISEVPQGDDRNYRCFEYSIARYTQFWQDPSFTPVKGLGQLELNLFPR